MDFWKYLKNLYKNKKATQIFRRLSENPFLVWNFLRYFKNLETEIAMEIKFLLIFCIIFQDLCNFIQTWNIGKFWGLALG